MSWRNFLTTSYWFSQPQSSAGPGGRFFTLVIAALILGGLFALAWRRRASFAAKRRLYGRAAGFAFTMGLLLALWVWLRGQHVWFLAWRFWLGVWAAAFIGWGGKLLWYATRRLPVIRAEQAARANQEKYWSQTS